MSTETAEVRMRRMIADGLRWAMQHALANTIALDEDGDALEADVQEEAAEIARWCCAVAGAPYEGMPS